MGCWGSKASADVAVADVYRPPPTSVSLFDISAVEEPWHIAKNKAGDEEEDDEEEEEETDDDADDEEEEKPAAKTVLPLPFLDKLEGYELAPASWSEEAGKKAPPPPAGLIGNVVEPECTKTALPELAGRRVVTDNPFLMRDRESTGSAPRWKRRDPFEGCPERRPPGPAGGGVVLYTTTLHGVRRTFEDCERARELVEACAEASGVGAVDERDVSLHGEYLRELRELTGDGASAPPRLFVMGRYVGGAEECVKLAESGKLREMMRWVKARGEACAAKDGRGCEGCGGARFVPCWECGGSRKVVVAEGGGEVERCAKCNENGLMMCPLCH
ncbi:hypothetical protein C2845_PM08G00280 [Panicum miliaceum]|uniref:Glutaredoxin domain-containing protein n=1 Tax=Panicum miliaceum TaxID=4540 RepID=A0A3L6QWT9_PANMI|nr:hypothetical protein C2845_PM08G00280 [Panicum miliaceum]